jgi:hypothetical protein
MVPSESNKQENLGFVRCRLDGLERKEHDPESDLDPYQNITDLKTQCNVA